MRYLFFLSVVCFVLACNKEQVELEINIDFPGGNILLDSIEKDTVYIRPDNRDSEQPWFYWYFEAISLQKQKVTFKFNQGNVMTTFGPAISVDDGNTWNWLFESPSDQGYFNYHFMEENMSVRFCMAMPYVQANLETFCKKYVETDRFIKSELAQTRKGRIIEKVIIRPETENVEAKVLITARHHASEMMANYIMEGIIDEVMNGDNLVFIRDHVEFIFIPFMDKDGVEQGDPGKHRRPRDHNRDYSGSSIYASTKMLRNEIPIWTNGLPLVAIDLHNPWIKYDNNEIAYMVGSSIHTIEQEQLKFSFLLDFQSKIAL